MSENKPVCQHCATPLSLQFVDLGTAPLSNAFNESQYGEEMYYPLRVLVCDNCWLCQTDISLFKLDHDKIFVKDYPYFSSTSSSFVAHAKKYVEDMTKRFDLGANSLIVEVGANDGYLLSHVKTPCYGIEPTATGEKAKEKGIKIITSFFTEKLAIDLAKEGKADLVCCNNTIAHVPTLNDFVKGFTALLKDTGVVTFEFPHLLSLVNNNQFDTIYHEHYSYLSLTAVRNIFNANGLYIFDVEYLDVHGGSLRVYAQKTSGKYPVTLWVRTALDREMAAGVTMGITGSKSVEIDGNAARFYSDFQKSAERVKNNLLVFLLQAKQMKRTVAAFGAAAKGNTLLNFAGVRSDLVQYVVDDTPSKQGKYLPGSRIPVKARFDTDPDYVLILPWNFKKEIIKNHEYMRDWGCKFVTAVPSLEIS